MKSWIRFYAWKTWNRTRYYWPQAKSRRRAEMRLRADYARYGLEPRPRYRRPWWIP